MVELPIKLEPYEHQTRAFNFCRALSHSALLMEQGTGKTLVAIAQAGYHFEAHRLQRLLVVCPKILTHTWKREFKKVADFPYHAQIYNRKEPEAFLDFPQTQGLQVALINYESMWRVEDLLNKWRPHSINADESQRIKKKSTRQSAGIYRIGKIVKYRQILTGTPILNTPLDIWAQYRFLDKSILGGFYPAFRDRYAEMNRFYPSKVAKYRRLKELATKIHSIAFRVTKDECLDLPERVDQYCYCELEPSAQKRYNLMEKKMLLQFPDGRIELTPLVMTKVMRLQQIVGGFVKNPEGEIIQVSRNKLDALRELLTDILLAQEKVVIFARFRPEIKAITELVRKMNVSVDTIQGRQDNAGKEDAFQENPNPRVLVIQVQTGKLGLTLTRAHTAIIYSTTFSFEDYDQCRARLHRITQVNKVTYIYLLSKNSVDEQILEAVQNKRDLSTLVVDTYKYTGRSQHSGIVLTNDSNSDKFNLDNGENPRNQESHQTQTGGAIMGDPTKDKLNRLKNKGKGKGKGTPPASKDESKEKKGEAETPPPDPGITLKDICEEVGIDPKKARIYLRKSEIEKPPGSWRWDEGDPEIEKVKDLLETAVNPPEKEDDDE